MVTGIPCRAAVKAVAHPATPEPRISNRSCGGAPPCSTEEEVVEEVANVDFLMLMPVEVERLRRDDIKLLLLS